MRYRDRLATDADCKKIGSDENVVHHAESLTDSAWCITNWLWSWLHVLICLILILASAPHITSGGNIHYLHSYCFSADLDAMMHALTLAWSLTLVCMAPRYIGVRENGPCSEAFGKVIEHSVFADHSSVSMATHSACRYIFGSSASEY